MKTATAVYRDVRNVKLNFYQIFFSVTAEWVWQACPVVNMQKLTIILSPVVA